MPQKFTPVIQRRERDKLLPYYALLYPTNVFKQATGEIGKWRVKRGQGGHWWRWCQIEKIRLVAAKKFETRIKVLSRAAHRERGKVPKEKIIARREKRGRVAKWKGLMAIHESRKVDKERRLNEAREFSRLSHARKLALEERALFLADWNSKNGALFAKYKETRRRHRKKRDASMRAGRRLDPEVKRKEYRIRKTPVVCHWCQVFLPLGGEVDHLTPLGQSWGTHQH